jgi:hypothetical protein
VSNGRLENEADMPKKSSVPIIYLVAKESLIAQQTQKGALETKSNTLVGFAGGMIALLIAAKDAIQSMPSIARMIVLISISLFLMSILLATLIGWVRKYRTDPNPSALAEHYLNESEEEVQLQLIANLSGAWESNSRQIERNAMILRLALFAQTTAFILLGIVVVWLLL